MKTFETKVFHAKSLNEAAPIAEGRATEVLGWWATKYSVFAEDLYEMTKSGQISAGTEFTFTFYQS